ncbi:glucose-methanol-choline (gmc) oxidoreductase [Ophiocordyceps camponoti-floridani]|uniref:Glucose-methanol-choline (Gmc) oxidoreductase n=1 Tax=Ophiocordyceps camponoti-floridani TaxID=2030778 RepID=A0A8H4Q6Z8_9HYPO|nr:glucose-methanol-choline (gmc) oxidoreductase [Ophiocordyceps camponoti-floridani]
MASDGSHYDFIVVGGGTAGNVVAGRLAENANVSILIVEAGIGNPREVTDITTPALAMDLRGSDHDWQYKTTMVRRDDYERIEKPNTRGKALGGSSSLNYFTWIPGCKPTFDMWEEYGGKEWTWDPLVPYLRKSAKYHDDDGLYSPDLNKIGPDGHIPISHCELIEEMAPFRENVIKAWKSHGGEMTENIYDGEMNGLTHCCASIYHGQRSGSWWFLEDKPKITVCAEATSKNLIIDKADKTCKGVTVIKEGKEMSFFADREVIVSEGVFETPKLLKLSGIGPADELKRHGIETVVDSQHVGEHLLDHPGVPFVLEVKPGFGCEDELIRPGPKHEAAVARYKDNKGGNKGPMGSGLLELVGFPRIDDYLEKDETYRKAKAANGGKDIFSPEGQPHFELDFVCMFGKAFQWHYPIPKEGNYTTVMVDLVRPVSEGGTVKLRSTDPLEQADINLNFFADDLDIIAMREGIRYTYDVLLKGDGFKDLVVKQYPWDMPLDDDKAMHRAVLDRCQTSFHPCGTARLSKNIEQGVVDAQLKVHGMKNLRVIDASVIPVIPDCRIQNSVYMCAEKGADAIKAAHADLYK